MSDRRHHPRITREYPVDIRLFDVPHTATSYKLPLVHGRALDISETGLRIETPVEMPIGHRIHLRVMVDNPPSSYLHTALVRWVRPTTKEPYTTGLEFVTTTAASRQDWSELVHHVMREVGLSGLQSSPAT